MSETRERAVGIDLGTTQSVVAYVVDGKPETIRNAEGNLTTPSLVGFHPSGIVVGDEAVKCAEFEPEMVADYAKRDMGRPEHRKTIRGRRLPPEVIQSFLVKRLMEDARNKLGDVNKAVITVPAYFNEPRRKATQDVGSLADIEVLDIINEPTAAAIAYGVQEGFLSASGETEEAEIILVYDLGGGTFDVTLMKIDGHRYRTIATAGDVQLGGIDWDQEIVNHAAEKFVKQHGIDPRNDPAALSGLMRQAQSAKHTLTARSEATFQFAYQNRRLRFNLAQCEFERLTEHLLQRTLFTVRRVLSGAGRKWSEVTRLLLAGGSTRMPMVRRMLEEEAGRPVDKSLSPDEAVAHGAAIYADLLVSERQGVRPEIVVTNVNSHDLGVLGRDLATGRPRRRILIPRNTPLPATRKSRFVTRRDNQTKVDVHVVEGGNDTGDGAAHIGKCTIAKLPPGLPAKSPLSVLFSYSADGRLHVTARLPSAGREEFITIERVSGLSDQSIEQWRRRIEAGLFNEEPPAARDPAAAEQPGRLNESNQPGESGASVDDFDFLEDVAGDVGDKASDDDLGDILRQFE